MVPTQGRDSSCAFAGELPIRTQALSLDDIIDFLHKKYNFPSASAESVSSCPSPQTGRKLPKESYVKKLKSLMELDSSGVHDAIDSLDTVAREQRNGWKDKNGVRKLIKEFERILESQLSDVQEDRDLSILSLIGARSVWREGTERIIKMPGKKEPDNRRDGRFGDPMVEYPSPATSSGGKSPQTRWESEIPGSYIPTCALNTSPSNDWGISAPPHLLGQPEQNYLSGTPACGEIANDVEDSDNDSFYSSSETLPQSEPVERFDGTPCPSPFDGSSIQRIQRPLHTVGHTAGPGTVRQISYLRPSMSNGAKRPLNSGFGTRRGFHTISSKQQIGFEGPIHTSFCTTSSDSAQSSFNTSESFSSRDLSPLTSADTSFDETEDPGQLVTRPTKCDIARLDMVVGGIKEIRFDRVSVSHNGDLDEETTEIDDSETNYALKYPEQRAGKPPKPPPPTTPQERSSQRRGKVLTTPQLIEDGGDSGKDKKMEEEEEEACQMLAEAYFSEEFRPEPGSLLMPNNTPSRKQKGGYLVINEDVNGEAEAKAEDLASEWVNMGGIELEKEGDTEELDDDDFGSIDTSFENEISNITALNSTAHQLPTQRFSVQYEATRVALDHGFRSDKAISTHLQGYCDDLYEAKDYSDIWETLSQFTKEATPAAETLERTSDSVWRRFKGGYEWPDDVCLTGRVYYDKTQWKISGKEKQLLPQEHHLKDALRITLNPLTHTAGNRFFNRFGSDRFLTLRLPSLSDPRSLPKDARERIFDWLADDEIQLMNRTWKCFYIKPGSSKKKSADKIMATEHFFQAVYFATKGVGIGSGISDQEMEELGFKKDLKKLRQEMSVEELLEWHIPLSKNLSMTVPKFWSRISLGFSDAKPTITFEPSQIEFVDDIKSPIGEVMNDGCSIASPAIMKMVREKLSLKVTPTAVQARLGGAKGVWMVDPTADWNSHDINIKITTSQLKYKGYDNDEDWARLTLDVLSTSHDPTPATINTQLIPILADRGVPFEVLAELLDEHLEGDLEELFRIIDQPMELRKWMYNRGNLVKERMMANTITTLGSIPVAKQERVIMLLESGFVVRDCQFLMEQVRKIIDQYCDDLKQKLHIRIPHSTALFCVADPTGTLREGEVSLRFSNGILDPKTMRRNPVVIGDILVARNPAHLPSDIQKVKAVDIQPYHSAGLRELQDVIVFSVQGKRSLASLLSGGDYDGDKPWVCWDERLVSSFQNSTLTYEEDEERVKLYFEKSPTRIEDLNPHQAGFFSRFLRAGISNTLQESFLGHCTTVWEKYCYANGISHPKAIEMAKICSLLVDASKQGLSIVSSKKDEITRLGNLLPKPAYKGLGSLRGGTHVIDRLHHAAGKKVMEKQTAFYKNFGEGKYDHQLTEIYHQARDSAEKEGPLDLVLKHLREEVQRLGDEWRDWTALKDGFDGFKVGVPPFYKRFREIKPPVELSRNPVMNRWISGEDFRFSYWDVLRASAAYYYRSNIGKFVWYMAGQELCFIKTLGLSRELGIGLKVLREDMYVSLKSSGKLGGIKKAVAEEEKEEEEEEEAEKDKVC